MANYKDRNEWVEEVYIVDVNTPVLGGHTAWQGKTPISGFSNASVEQLANRTRFLKDSVETLERVLEVKTEGVMLGENNLSELTDIQEAKYRLELNLVDNTRDKDKPVSDKAKLEFNKKVDKESGKELYPTEDKLKLQGIESGATKNKDDNFLLERENHTGTQPISSVENLQEELSSKIGSDDERLTNSREWTASTVSKAEAEAGTATTRRAWTSQRVRQAIEGWWSSVSSAFGKLLINSTDKEDAKNLLGLSDVATSGDYSDIVGAPELISLSEAEEGNSTTPRTINAKVLSETISSAVSGEISADALLKNQNLSDIPDKGVARDNLGLGSAATKDVGESSGNVMEVGAFGIGGHNAKTVPDINTNIDSGVFTTGSSFGVWGDTTLPRTWSMYINMVRNSSGHGAMIAVNSNELQFGRRNSNGVDQEPLRTVWHDGNFNPSDKLSVGDYGVGGAYRINRFGDDEYLKSIENSFVYLGNEDGADSSELLSGFGRYTNGIKLKGDNNRHGFIGVDGRDRLAFAGSTGGSFGDLHDVFHSGNFNPDSKQDSLVAGSNVQIAADGKTISATNSTYSVMSLSEMRTGTATTARTMSSKNIDDFTNFVNLTGNTVSINFNSGRNFSSTITGNATINNPTNARSGSTGDIVITSTADRTLSFGNAWKFMKGEVPSVKANSRTVISYKVLDSSNILCAFAEDVK